MGEGRNDEKVAFSKKTELKNARVQKSILYL